MASRHSPPAAMQGAGQATVNHDHDTEAGARGSPARDGLPVASAPLALRENAGAALACPAVRRLPAKPGAGCPPVLRSPIGQENAAGRETGAGVMNDITHIIVRSPPPVTRARAGRERKPPPEMPATPLSSPRRKAAELWQGCRPREIMLCRPPELSRAVRISGFGVSRAWPGLNWRSGRASLSRSRDARPASARTAFGQIGDSPGVLGVRTAPLPSASRSLAEGMAAFLRFQALPARNGASRHHPRGRKKCRRKP